MTITILLTETSEEAESYARAASLRKGDYLVASSIRRVEGLRVTDDDLIAEFHSFKRHPDHDAISDCLLANIVRAATKPRWERIGQ